jgi:hypothetical protein
MIDTEAFPYPTSNAIDPACQELPTLLEIFHRCDRLKPPQKIRQVEQEHEPLVQFVLTVRPQQYLSHSPFVTQARTAETY